MKINAYAKINLILDVNRKLKNGYHDISFLMTCVNIYDEIEIIENNNGIDEVIVLDNELLSNENNIAFKALILMKKIYKIKRNYKIIINKKIPIAAGMAGGSTDAAAVINAINLDQQLQLTKKELIDIGIQIGADVPFCIFSRLSIVEGIGEKVEFINHSIPDSHVLIINPGIELSTKNVYENHKIEKIKRKSINEILELSNYNAFYSNLRNDLEKTAIHLEPIILEIKNDINNIIDVTKIMVSGSGPTVIVFDNDRKKLQKIYNVLKNKYYYVKITKIKNV